MQWAIISGLDVTPLPLLNVVVVTSQSKIDVAFAIKVRQRKHPPNPVLLTGFRAGISP